MRYFRSGLPEYRICGCAIAPLCPGDAGCGRSSSIYAVRASNHEMLLCDGARSQHVSSQNSLPSALQIKAKSMSFLLQSSHAQRGWVFTLGIRALPS
jgi:hypothetical protein